MSTEKKLTAIDELIQIVEMDYNNGVEISMKVFHKMLTDAKLKEKQQIIDACDYFGNLNGVDKEDFEQYYSENFKN